MPGTGELCPCGSTMPYPACCMGRGVLFPLEQARWRQISRYLRYSLAEYADRSVFAWETARAQDLYLGSLERRLAGYEDDHTLERCSEWFIFDYKLSSGRTVVEEFRKEYAEILDEYEAVLLSEWTRSYISIYQVKKVIPGCGFKIKDLIMPDGELLVREMNATPALKRGDILMIRVLKAGWEYEFSNSGLILPGESKKPFLRIINRARRQHCGGAETGQSGLAFLKEQAHEINALVLEYALNTAGQAGDDRLRNRISTECRTFLTVADWQKVYETLKRSEFFRFTGEVKNSDGSFRHATAVLLGDPYGICEISGKGERPAPAGSGVRSGKERGLRPVLAHMVLTKRLVVLNAASPARLTGYAKRLADKLGGLVTGAEGDNYSWPEPGYAVVAGRVREGLKALGYNASQQKNALKLWHDYCSKEQPSIRKTAVWAATVIYTLARLEMEEGPKQQELAGRYGIASSTISSKYRLICRSLDLVAYDRRYTTKKPPQAMKRS